MAWPPHSYRKGAERIGRTESLCEAALAQAAAVQASGLPAILTLKHLGELSGISYASLRDFVSRGKDPYRAFRIAKRSGRGYRDICIPSAALAACQRFLNREVLAKASTSPHCYSYAGRNPVDCARIHVGCRWLLKLDVVRFFESISEREVYRVYTGLGYQPLVAFELSRICTRVYPEESPRYTRPRWRRKKKHKFYSDVRVGHLPQGAPTSPRLSNLVCEHLDKDIAALAAERGFVYSRYSDDLQLSTGAKSSRKEMLDMVQAVGQLLRKHGLRPNAAKTHIAPPGARKVVLGLLVDGERPRLTKTLRQRLLTEVYHLNVHGVVGHVETLGFSSVRGYRRHLLGRVSYAASVDEGFAAKVRAKLEIVKWPDLD